MSAPVPSAMRVLVAAEPPDRDRSAPVAAVSPCSDTADAMRWAERLSSRPYAVSRASPVLSGNLCYQLREAFRMRRLIFLGAVSLLALIGSGALLLRRW